MLRSFPHAVGVHAVLASSYAATGQREPAERHFDAIARDDFGVLPRGINWLTELSLLADAACRLGDKQRAQLVYDALLPYADELAISGGEVGPGAPMSYQRGDLAIVLGEFDHAQAWLRRAREAAQKLNATLLLQFCAIAEARLLFVSARQLDLARELARGVVAFAERTGAAWLRSSALALERDSLALRERMMTERTLRPRSLRALDETFAPASKRPR
jgi:tetratricopeptide (TPR) repeat protein